MSAIPSAGVTPPKLNSPQIGDAINWVQEGNCLILHVNWKCAYVFHQCIRKTSGKASDKMQNIYVRMPNHETVNKWQEFLIEAGCHPCKCPIKMKVLSKNAVNHLLKSN